MRYQKISSWRWDSFSFTKKRFSDCIFSEIFLVEYKKVWQENSKLLPNILVVISRKTNGSIKFGQDLKTFLILAHTHFETVKKLYVSLNDNLYEEMKKKKFYTIVKNSRLK